MKRVTILSVLFCVGYISAEKKTVSLDPEKMVGVVQSLMSCLLEAPIDPEVLLQIRSGAPLSPQTLKDKNLHKFAYCTAVKSGYAKKNGHFKIDKMLALFPEDIDKDQLKKALEECNTLEGKDPTDTAFTLIKCFKEKSPYKVVL